MFHQLTYDTFGFLPFHSPEVERALRDAEVRLALRLPAAMREWYVRPDAISLVSRQDVLLPLDKLQIIEVAGNRYLKCMVENQGVCVWAVRLGADDDPEVIVNVDGAGWTNYCPKFSILIFGQIWDWNRGPFGAFSQAPSLKPRDLSLLKEQFKSLPGVTAWPTPNTFRFVRGDQTVLLWAGDEQCDWNLGSQTESGFQELLQTVWSMSNLSDSLFAAKSESKVILQEMRRS